MSFKKNFMWGAATAAYQIEGAAYADGKGLSIWDVFSHEPGKVYQNEHGDIACNHYELYKGDIALMKQIGLEAYRMSISWPRVMPEGVGKVNEKGLDYYDRVIDELLRNNITPYVTLFHWDYPYDLHRKGGWLNPDSPKWFAEYTETIMKRYSDRVENWMTINEPQIIIGFGYVDGNFAPGHRVTTKDFALMSHNLLLSHGNAVQVIRETAKKPSRIGYAPCCSIPYPETDKKEDEEAARQALFHIKGSEENSFIAMHAALWMEPVYRGKYSDELLQKFGELLPKNYEEDLKVISQELDFFGINIYHGIPVHMGADGSPQLSKIKPGQDVTAFNWNIMPKALYYGPKFFYERYKKPIIITENGLSSKDRVSPDGKVHDIARIDFLRDFLSELKRAAADGTDIDGYFQWSLMDNYEWSSGYRERFGLIHVDFETQKRTIKESGYWYKKLIESNGASM